MEDSVQDKTRVTIECLNLQLKRGTGIATYARTLNSTLRSLSYSTTALIEVEKSPHKDNPILSEIELFDADDSDKGQRRLPSSFIRSLFENRHVAESESLCHGNYVLNPNPWMNDFDEVRGVVHMDHRAMKHFDSYGTFLKVQVPDCDIFHATQAFPLAVSSARNLYTVHDLIPLRVPYATLGSKRYFYDLVKEIARSADKIVTVSEFSRKDIIATFGVPEDRIVNTYQAVSLPKQMLESSVEQVSASLMNKFGLEFGDYFLFVGAIEPKKNVSRLISAYLESGSNRPLVIAGGLGWQYDNDVKLMKDSQARGRRVHYLDYVSRTDLVKLLRGARSLVFPSLYEGFGLPVLEAMMVGTSVITSNTSSLPEVAGEAAEYVNPFDEEDIARALRVLDQDNSRCAELVSLGYEQVKKFSPERYTERLKSLYSSLN